MPHHYPPPAETLARSDHRFVPGTAVFLTSDAETAPSALLQSLKHYDVLHELNIVVTVETVSQPVVPTTDRLSLSRINDWMHLVTLHFGFMEDPNVPKALMLCRDSGIEFNPLDTSYFLTRRTLIASGKIGMPVWRDKLFIALARNAAGASAYFHLPTARVVEIGSQIEI